MATFEAQVEGLTGLSIDSSSAPTQNELSEFLKDGVIDVTNKCILLNPKDKILFTAESAEQTSNNSFTVKGEILSIVREGGTDNDWRNCRYISPAMQGRVVDSDSLNFASKFNPVYTILDNGKINVFPTPSATTDAFKVYFINNDPKRDSDAAALAFDSEDIRFFPKDKVYLVVIYASIKSLQNALSSFTLSTFSLSASAPASVPSAPTISGGSVSAISIAALPTAPTYTAPSVASDGSIELTTIVQLDSENTIDDFDGNAVEVDQWWTTLAHLIEDEEDTELAQAQLQKISTYIQAYSQAMQNQLNVFNDANIEYQANIQRNIEQARLDMQDAQKEADLTLQAAIQDYSLELQRVSTDVSKFQALVNSEVQTYQQKIAEQQTEYNFMIQRLQDLKQEYNQAFAIMAPRQQGGS